MNKLMKLLPLLPVFTLLFALNSFANTIPANDLALTVSIDLEKELECHDDDDGILSANPDGGLPPYEYEWSNGKTNPFIYDLDAGEYSVTITDDAGNTATASYTLTEPDELEVELVDIVNATCDEEDGAIYIDVSGGVEPYKITWSNGVQSEDLENAPDGEYTVLVKDANGCNRKFGPFDIEDDCIDPCDAPNLDDFSVNDGNCEEDNGSIYLSIENVNLPHTFVWTNGWDEEDLENAEPGTYSMTLTDATGCTAVFGPFEIDDPCDDIPCFYKPALSNVIIGNADCGEENGFIDITIEGSDPPFTYMWNYNGLTTEDISNLAPGDYGVVVTDTEGCEDKFSFVVKEDCTECEEPVISSVVVIESTCDAATGQAFINMVGGPASFDFNWSQNVSDSYSATDLESGIYSVTITGDDPECAIVEVFSVGNSDGPQPEVLATTPASCNQANGTAVMSDLSLTYLWDNGNTSSNPTDLTAGAHLVIVTDPATGCTNVIEVYIEEFTVLQASANIISQPTVNQNDGEVEIVVTNGSFDYTYTWSDGGPDQAIRDDLEAGAYSVTITDNGATGCEVVVNFVLGNGVIFTITGDPSISCPGDNDGTIDYSFEPANADVTVTIVDPSTGQEYQNGSLAPGFYCLVATDNSTGDVVGGECFELTVPEQIDVDFAITDASCAGLGSIETVDIMGGNGGYIFDWDNIQGTDDPQDNLNLTPGTYGVVVTDALGCTAFANIPVGGSNDAITIDDPATVVDPSCGEADGSITVQVSGGSGSFDYNWNGTSGPNPYTDLAAGTYDLTVTDIATGCTTTATYTLMEAEEVILIAPSDTLSCAETIDLNASSTNATSISWYDANDQLIGSGENVTLNVPNPAETITVVGMNDAGCTTESSFTLGSGAITLIDPAVITNPGCDAEDGSIAVQVNGGSGSYEYSWNGMIGPNPNTNLGAGTYDLIVTDTETGCTVSDSYTLMEPEQIILMAPSDTTVCADTINLSASSPNATMIFWFNEGGQLLATGENVTLDVPDPAEEITVQAINDAGCFSSSTFLLGQGMLGVGGVVIVSPPCEGVNIGSISVEISGGSGMYDYLWNGMPGTNMLSDLEPGTYILEVTDQVTGCSANDTLIISAGPGVELEVPDDQLLCLDEVDLSASSNADMIEWFDEDGNPVGQGEDVTLDVPDVATEYTVIATDDSGCTAEDMFTITPDGLEIDAGLDQEACFDENVTYFASPSQGITYQWSADPNFSDIISNLDSLDVNSGNTPGEEFTYYVQGTTASGCVDVDTVVLSNNGVAAFINPPGIICPEDETAVGIEIGLGTPGELTYSWSSPDATIDVSDPTTAVISSEVSTTVSVTVENDLGCSFTQTFPFDISELDASIDAAPLEIEQGESTTLDLIGYDPSYTLEWSGDPSLSSTTDPTVTVNPDQTTTISVLITDENGCTIIRSVLITVLPAQCNNRNIFFPNAFTPNGDAINDILRLRGNNVDEVYFAVYDRWGEKVFESNSINDGWDGVYKGEELGNDVYGYYLRVRCADGEQFFQQGNVSLLR